MDLSKHLSTILSAMAALAALASAGFFLRFWKLTRDGFFGLFALAFAFLAADQLVMAFSGLKHEEHGVLYWVRIAGYGLILVAIFIKNVRPRRAR